jgi:imidazole glycerol-phosphate synthase subunit HisH
MTLKIAIIDNHMGNIGSVVNAFSLLRQEVVVSDKPSILKKANAYILPGVGAFPQAMRNLKDNNLVEFLDQQIIHKKKPYLGICLGMQILATTSEEQTLTKGLGWIDGEVVLMKSRTNFPIPHVGWNHLDVFDDQVLLKGIEKKATFYFDHSYQFLPKKQESVSATTEYGNSFASIVNRDNIFGTQFHPEKSQRKGLKVLRNFINYIDDN